MRKPPLVIDGSRVLYYSVKGPFVTYVGQGLIFVGGRDLGPVPRLIIAEHLREKGFQLLHCDKNWNALAHDGGHHSVAEAKHRAERMYPGISRTWVKCSVSKRKALAIERKMWRGQECSFCDRIPPEFDRWIHGKKAGICNICVDEIYRDFVEMQAMDSVKPPGGDYFAKNGFAHIAPYISRLVSPTDKHKYLMIFALDRTRGCGLIVKGGMVQVSFLLKGQQKSTREATIREFFVSRGQRPSSDYLASNGATRILQFPVNGSVKELAAMTKTILQELCDVWPTEAITIRYGEQ